MAFATILIQVPQQAAWLSGFALECSLNSGEGAIRQNRIKRQKTNIDLIKRFASGQLQMQKVQRWGHLNLRLHLTQPTRKSIITGLTSPLTMLQPAILTASQKARNNIAVFKADYAIKIQHIAVLVICKRFSNKATRAKFISVHLKGESSDSKWYWTGKYWVGLKTAI